MTSLIAVGLGAIGKGSIEAGLAASGGDGALGRIADFLIASAVQPGFFALWYLAIGLAIGSQYEAWVRQSEADTAASERVLPVRRLHRKARELRSILRSPVLRLLSRAKFMEADQLTAELGKVGYPPLPLTGSRTAMGRKATIEYLDIAIPHLSDEKLMAGRQAVAAFLSGGPFAYEPGMIVSKSRTPRKGTGPQRKASAKPGVAAGTAARDNAAAARKVDSARGRKAS